MMKKKNSLSQQKNQIPVIILFILIGIILIFYVRSLVKDHCDEYEKAIFNEFPQYGSWIGEEINGATLDFTPKDADEAGSSCGVSYSIPGTIKEVEEYYKEQLIVNDWKIGEIYQSCYGNGLLGGGVITALRDGFLYYISYEERELDYGGQLINGMYIVSRVRKDEYYKSTEFSSQFEYPKEIKCGDIETANAEAP